ncbi:MAG: polysaccharide deacetylase family protein [Candidatus Cloacimonetes bacterium]|nr:polysaccharide deacetylase family protein [Candidatus Cloacimonadota bacterium]
MRSTLAPLIAFLVIALHACGGDTPGRDAAAAIPDSAPANAETGADIVTDSASTPAAGGPDSVAETSSPRTVHAIHEADAAHADRTPNELGRIPILEYHLIGPQRSQWTVTPEDLRTHLEMLYERGYRPVNLRDVVDRRLDLPRGLSPVVLTFDDASPSQFRYIEREDGSLEIDPESAVGILLEFARTHPGWENRAVFCMLPAAEAGRSFFGDKGIEGQKSEWRFRKVRFLAEQGFELCNHTLWHANLAKYEDAFVQEQIARGELAIDSAVSGYDVRSFALPLGEWPRRRELAWQGSWTDPKTGRTVSYAYDVVLLVAGGPARSPHDPQFDPLRLPRFIVYGEELPKLLDRMDRDGSRYVSDGDPSTVARPEDP